MKQNEYDRLENLPSNYYICEAQNSIVLEESVNTMIRNGWTPQGGMTIEHYSKWNYMQAMYRPPNPTDIENARRQREGMK